MIKKAVRKGKGVILNSENIYHFKRPGESGDGDSWGTPAGLNVMKLLMYRNVLRQAQEALGHEHIYPWRIYYLQETQSHDPNMNYNVVAKNLAGELTKMVRDPNYKVISPIPVGVINLGGQGRSLMLTPEIEQVQAEILAGMNVPREFIFGGVSYSGSSFSLRILENHFITYRFLLKDFVQNFLIKKLAVKNGEFDPEKDDNQDLIQVSFADLKMQDDVQQKQLIINLNGAGKLPDEEVYNVLGVDPDTMRKKLKDEMLERIETEKEIQLVKLDADFEVQKKQLEQQIELEKLKQELLRKAGLSQPEMIPGDGSGGGAAPTGAAGVSPAGDTQQQPQQAQQTDQARVHREALKIATKLLKAPEETKAQLVAQIPPELKGLVASFYEQLQRQGQEKKQPDQGVDMRPYPDQKPPRRKTLG
jgi:ribosomal protein S13